MKTTRHIPKPTFSVAFAAGATGVITTLEINPRSHEAMPLQGSRLPVSRKAMALIVRHWRRLGSPQAARGITPATTAVLSMARLGKLGIGAAG